MWAYGGVESTETIPDESVLAGIKEFPEGVRGYFVATITLADWSVVDFQDIETDFRFLTNKIL